MIDFETFYKRMERLGIENQTELAEILNITPSAITDAKRRKTIPPIWAVKISKKYELDLDWVLGIPLQGSQERGRIEFHLIRECMLEIKDLRERIQKLEKE